MLVHSFLLSNGTSPRIKYSWKEMIYRYVDVTVLVRTWYRYKGCYGIGVRHVNYMVYKSFTQVSIH